MRWFLALFLTLIVGVSSVEAAKAARISKVLPHLLDEQGRHSLSPSLYERDAYQAHLRSHLELCSAMRFDIRWAGLEFKRDSLKVKMELRVSGEPKSIVLEDAIKSTTLSGGWTQVSITGDSFKKMGKLIAWRATLWEGDQQVAELKSFLW